MQKILKNQRGSHVIEIVLVVAVIALGIFGYYQVQQNQKLQKTGSPLADHKTLSKTAPAAQQVYLKVPEAGFKLKLSDDLQDLEYYAKPEASGVDEQGRSYTSISVYFTTKKLEQMDPQCSAEWGSLGAASKFNFDPSVLSPLEQGGEITKVGNIYVSFSGPQAACSEKASVQELQKQQIQLLKNKFKGMLQPL